MGRAKFTGSISTVTPCGRYAIVTLDNDAFGFNLAVINNQTRGRISLMNATGKLEVGVQVRGVGRRGLDGLVATTVTARQKDGGQS